MEQAKTEEKSPLLLYLSESEGNLSKNNKRLNFDKSRMYGISSGATAVFTEFPNYITPCGLTAILSGLIFLLMLLLSIATIGPSRSSRLPRCVGRSFQEFQNNAIHLVHYSMYWNLEELQILQTIKDNYPGYHVHILQLKHIEQNQTKLLEETTVSLKAILDEEPLPGSTAHKRSKRNVSVTKKRRTEYEKKLEPFIGMGVKSLLDILLNSRLGGGLNSKKNINKSNSTKTDAGEKVTSPMKLLPTFDTIVRDFDNLTIDNVSIEEAFVNTPLESCWSKFNTELFIFSLRVLMLWEFGGLSFKINEADRQEDVLNYFSVSPAAGITPLPFIDNKLIGFLNSGKQIFESLPEEVVTSDEEGLHMFTKTPCHAFFGEIILSLKKSKGDESVKKIIKKSLKLFCHRSTLGMNYCKNFVRRIW